MNYDSRIKPPSPVAELPFECIALLLQGGGALGSYQAGVFQALAEANIHPDWVAGISIGAINSALIAGNAPGQRVEKLRTFWESITDTPTSNMSQALSNYMDGDRAREWLNSLNATMAMFTGAPGFFKPRLPTPWFVPAGAPGATSFYDTSALKSTLEGLIDFDRINSGEMRFSVGAVNIRSGNFVYFDNRTHRIRAEHIMASGALPPGFPAVEIDGEHYWDGGLISNTPLDWVLNEVPRQNTLAFQVDLWSATGDFPRDLGEVAVRTKEIQYSSRTRASTTNFKETQLMRAALARLLDQLPKEIADSTDAKFLRPMADRKFYNIVELIYRSKHYEGQSKDYEFSRLTMEEHWRAGLNDATRTLQHNEIFSPPLSRTGVFTFDVAEHGRV